MGLDIRLPFGLLFSITGSIMTAYGLLTRGSEMYARAMGSTSIYGGVVSC